jgi:DNA-binding transcriptional MerR regulator/methylmalonyl-CoA mutase cobalamin-binding subunit
MKSSDPKHPISVVTLKTGLRPDVIRVWERRYGTVRPARTPSNRRLYSDVDVRRLGLLRRALDAGWRISNVAGLDDEELQRLVQEASESNAMQPEAVTNRSRLEDHLSRCVEAIIDMDGDRLRRQLERASVDLSRVDLLDNLLAPLMHRVGAGCAGGSMRTANEHLASCVVRTFLDGLHGAYPVSDTAPVLVVATPAFQYHELGALLVAAVGRMDGWKTVYLGSNLPAEELAAAANVRGARAIALSITYPADDPRLVEELLRLRRLVGLDVTILVGGPSSTGYRETLDDVEAIRIDHLAALREYLLAMRSSVGTRPLMMDSGDHS